MRTWSCTGLALAGLIATTLSGCGGNSDLGRVTGHVTLDGQPLAGAVVKFMPEAGGNASYGRTDESGKYELQYTRSDAGALIGAHRVEITTEDEGDPDSDPPIPASDEKLPPKYHESSELKADVAAGKQAIDFALTSGG